MFKHSLSLSIPIIVILTLYALVSLFSKNIWLGLESVIVIYLVYKLTWRRNEPPIVFIALCMQLIQVVISLIYANFNGVSLGSVSDFPYHIQTAFNYSAIGIVCLALGFNVVTYRIKPFFNVDSINAYIDQYNARKMIIMYLLFAILLAPLQALSFSFGSLQQIIYKFLELKWVLLFFLYFTTIHRNKFKIIFTAVILLEIGLGFTGFFSNYKEVIIAVGICYLTFSYRLLVKQYIYIGIAGSFVIFISIMWQYAKGDYRDYLSGESAQQVVTVSRDEALVKFFELASDFDRHKFKEGTEQLISRVSYIDYFSATIDFVPARRPYENGALYFDAVSRTFMPRFLFPSKEIVNDSERTTKYSGVDLRGRESGTSISMGYFSETYVDFGIPWMLIPIFLVGVLVGLIYKYVILYSYTKLWSYAYLLPLTYNFYSFETALSKIIPAIGLYFVIIFFFNKFLVKRIDSFMRR